MKFSKASYLFPALCVFFCLGCPKTPDEQLSAIPNDAVTRLYYPGAYHFQDARPATPKVNDGAVYSSVGYRISIKYPAKEIVVFYREKLSALGYEIYQDSKSTGGKCEWGCRADETNKKNPCIYRCLSDWVNQDKTRVAFLSIEYYSPYINDRNECGFKPDNNSAYVVVSSFPYEWSRQ